jgi:RNA polymerase sigma-70 factor (ECF subfamily)
MDSDWIDSPQQKAVFATTHWSVVLCATSDSTAANEALSRLCQVYWLPLYAYVRRQGQGPEEAKDLTQEFLARLLSKGYLPAVNRHKGKFRSFLLAAMEHFLAKEWRDMNRIKRGGGQTILSLDREDPESKYRIEPVEELTPERIYERRWALILLDQTMDRLRGEFAAAGKLPMFDALQVFLTGDRENKPYAQMAVELDMTEGAVKVAVHRLRVRYGEVLRAEIANTVSRPEEVDEELRYLMAVLSG